MTWKVIANDQFDETEFTWPYVNAKEWPWVVVNNDANFVELSNARAWCDDNNIRWHRIYSGMCLKSQDHATAFILRWG